MADEEREDELSLEELDEAAGGQAAAGADTNCVSGCGNTNCVGPCGFDRPAV